MRGLAWTSVGGDTLQIEVNMMPGKGEIDLTGQMGDVMKESAMIGMSFVRSIGEEYHIEPSVFKENDFHIHIPEGGAQGWSFCRDYYGNCSFFRNYRKDGTL